MEYVVEHIVVELDMSVCSKHTYPMSDIKCASNLLNLQKLQTNKVNLDKDEVLEQVEKIYFWPFFMNFIPVILIAV